MPPPGIAEPGRGGLKGGPLFCPPQRAQRLGTRVARGARRASVPAARVRLHAGERAKIQTRVVDAVDDQDVVVLAAGVDEGHEHDEVDGELAVEVGADGRDVPAVGPAGEELGLLDGVAVETEEEQAPDPGHDGRQEVHRIEGLEVAVVFVDTPLRPARHAQGHEHAIYTFSGHLHLGAAPCFTFLRHVREQVAVVARAPDAGKIETRIVPENDGERLLEERAVVGVRPRGHAVRVGRVAEFDSFLRRLERRVGPLDRGRRVVAVGPLVGAAPPLRPQAQRVHVERRRPRAVQSGVARRPRRLLVVAFVAADHAAVVAGPVWKSKFYGAFVLYHRVVLHAIDAVHPTHWLISTQRGTGRRRTGRARAGRAR